MSREDFSRKIEGGLNGNSKTVEMFLK